MSTGAQFCHNVTDHKAVTISLVHPVWRLLKSSGKWRWTALLTCMFLGLCQLWSLNAALAYSWRSKLSSLLSNFTSWFLKNGLIGEVTLKVKWMTAATCNQHQVHPLFLWCHTTTTMWHHPVTQAEWKTNIIGRKRDFSEISESSIKFVAPKNQLPSSEVSVWRQQGRHRWFLWPTRMNQSHKQWSLSWCQRWVT